MNYIGKEVQEILHRPTPVRGFAFKVTESPDGVFLLISLEELAKYSQPQQESISEWVAGVCNDIRKLHVPCYIQEWKRDGE